MTLRKLLSSKVFLCLALSIYLACSAFPAFAAVVKEEGYFENEYARIEWEASLSKEMLTGGEEFHVTLNLVSTIKEIPEEYQALVELANKTSVTAVFSYKIIIRNDETGAETPLYDKISKPLPKLEEGATLEFANERIPAHGYLVFPENAKYGRYTLLFRLLKVEGRAWLFTRDITALVRTFLPGEAFESGIITGVAKLVPQTLDLLGYYRVHSGDFEVTDTLDLLKAADDWVNEVVPEGFTRPITTMQLLHLADEWAGG